MIMLPEDKKAYLQKISDQLAEWETKIDALKVKGEHLAEEAKLEFEEQMAEMNEKRAELSAHLDELTDKADDLWEDVKEEAEEKWEKISTTVDHFISKFK
ncbi:MAG: hypothetical protein IPI97_10470 [Nitrosomonas sp.]|nr:hypothetical protein [Nitrosomonas sp.]